jgi:dihydroxyacetone kinase-like predicted kinase
MFLLRKFRMEFILGSRGVSEDMLRRALEGIGEDIEMSVCSGEEEMKDELRMRVSLGTDDPELVFDICSQYGRIKSAKIEETTVSGR